MHIYVGTLDMSGQSDGIHILTFDPATGAIERGPLVPVGSPSHLAIAPDRGCLYAATHTSIFEGEPGSGIVAFRIDPATGGLVRLNHQLLPFPHANYIIVNRDQRLVLVVAGIGGGVGVYPILEDGSLAPASASFLAEGTATMRLGETIKQVGMKEIGARRPTSTSPHSIVLDPSGRFAVATDAGRNRLLLYRLDTARGGLDLHQILDVEVPASAPRHSVFHPGGETLYVVNEHNSSIAWYAFDQQEGRLSTVGTIATVPAGREKGNNTADIKIDRSGRFLYSTNRGDETIALFSVKDGGRSLERIETVPCGGVHPRGICLSPDGRFLLVANQGPNWRFDQPPQSKTPEAGVAVLSVDPDTGRLTNTGHWVQLDLATCIAFNI